MTLDGVDVDTFPHPDRRCTGGDVKVLARVATSVLHSVAVRARAGARRSELMTIARATAELIVGRTSDVKKHGR